eukprot:CAMPEP_0184483360 /NCGR_PEP_ID=MMETSP0113_2-20130426/5017_1 /TAXON_ID=91329 /ORGANISM="Norrisiella sphaerica, Strain BC52" /LENGTH=573 /DNA_ID=CAMNT_0026863709 /DNA_START=99 /DNA_END=1820 /DNA_ORIENTATION=+
MASRRIDPYWLVAFPQEYKGNSRVGLQKLVDALRGYAKVVKFDVPGNLKIGTLDSLMSLTESLSKVDALIGLTLGKVSKTLEELLGKATELGVGEQSKTRYVETFQWSFVKFKTSSSLQGIVEGIETDVKKYDADIKKLVSTYNEVSQTLDSIERTDTGSLLVRPLGPIIKKVELYPSPSLELIFIVVGNKKKEEFLKTYETMEIGYKKRREAKEKEDQANKLEHEQNEVEKNVPTLLAGAEEDEKRAKLLQGGAVYRHVADLMRKTKNVVEALESGSSFGKKGNGEEKFGVADTAKKLKADYEQLRDLLADAIEQKLAPYESQAPNTTGAKRAVVDVILTAEEFEVKVGRVDTCRKLVIKEYQEAQTKIEKHKREMKRAQDRKKIQEPPYVVPGSANLIKDDDEYSLYSIVIMKKFKDEFLKICREKRLTVRAYKYDVEGEKKHHKKKQQLAAEKKKSFNHAQLKCRHLYPEIFIGWMHIKAIRCFAESILRYGLPKRNEDFKMIFPNHVQAALVQVSPGREPQARKIMGKLYSGLASEDMTRQLDSNETDFSGFGADFYPYVYLPIDLNHG